MIKWSYLLFLLLFSHFGYSQNDTTSIIKPKIGIVSVDKMNIVYRGVLNPISIAVPGVKSFTASGQGLKIIKGKYYIAPGQGLETIIRLNIVLNDNSEITEEHKFRIKRINPPTGIINGIGCSKCIIEMTKEELINAEISFKIDDFVFETHYAITGFDVNFSKRKKINIVGNHFTVEALNLIKKLKKGSIFTIENIHYFFPGSENYMLPRVSPIKIMIVEKEIEVNYYESKEFIKDSLQNIKIQKKLVKKQLRDK